jgi:hypothetical protein
VTTTSTCSSPCAARYVAIDVKSVDFEPEFTGKMNFYLSAVDDLLRHPDDQPSVGLILCKGKSKVVAEYALRGATSRSASPRTRSRRRCPRRYKEPADHRGAGGDAWRRRGRRVGVPGTSSLHRHSEARPAQAGCSGTHAGRGKTRDRCYFLIEQIA